MLRRSLLCTLPVVLLIAAPAPAEVTVHPASAGEHTGSITFTITRTSPLEDGLVAGTADGTATAGSDFRALTDAPVTFDGASDLEATVRVDLVDDGATEPPERFSLVVSNAVVNTEVARGTGTITDPPGLVIEDVAVREDAGEAAVAIRATPVTRNVSVAYAGASGTAIGQLDFDGRGGRVTIPAGAAGAAIRIPLGKDAVDEEDETFTVTLNDPAGTSIARDRATVTILNDDLRAISVGDARVQEADDGLVIARVPVTLNAATFRLVTVQYATVDGLARAPRDYLARLGQLTIPPGQSSGFFEVSVVGDDLREGTESFGVLVGHPRGASVNRSAGTVTVLDDDGTSSDDEVPPNVRVRAPVRRGRTVRVRLSCPRNERRCSGRVTLFSRRDRRARARTLRREHRLGRRSFRLSGGRARTVRIRIPRRILAAARRSGRLKVRAYVLTRDPAGNVDTATRAATLRFRR